MISAGVGHSTYLGLEQAVKEASALALEQAGTGTANFLLAFATTEFASHPQRLLESLQKHTGTSNIVGCSTLAVITGQGEFERQPGLAVLVLSSPELSSFPFLIEPLQAPAAEIAKALSRPLEKARQENPLLLLFTDLFHIHAPELIEDLRQSFQSIPVIGGAASAHPEDKYTVQWAAGRESKKGVSGALLWGPIAHSSRTAQGCEAIGEPYIITHAEGKVIHQIGNRPAHQMLQEALSLFPSPEIERVSRGIFVGILYDERKYPPRQGDYLMRSIESTDPSAGTISIVENVRAGQTVQFHVRNPSRARAELETAVRDVAWDTRLATPLFALYIESVGRGGRLHKDPKEDVKIIREGLGDIPIIGFLSNAEFGPRGTKNLVHSYSAVLTVVYIKSG